MTPGPGRGAPPGDLTSAMDRLAARLEQAEAGWFMAGTPRASLERLLHRGEGLAKGADALRAAAEDGAGA